MYSKIIYGNYKFIYTTFICAFRNDHSHENSIFFKKKSGSYIGIVKLLFKKEVIDKIVFIKVYMTFQSNILMNLTDVAGTHI